MASQSTDANANASPSRKNAEITRGKPFAKGNPGRPPGSRNKATIAVEALLEGEAEQLTRKAIELAQQGNVLALKLCLDRYAPVRREKPVPVDLPIVRTVQDAVDASTAVIEAASRGEISLSDAEAYLKALIIHQELCNSANRERRISRLEEQQLPRRIVDLTDEERREMFANIIKDGLERWKKERIHKSDQERTAT